MDSRDNRNRSSSQSQDHHRNPDPNPNPNPAATTMAGGSTSTSQSTPHRLTFGALSLPNLNQPARSPQLQQQQMVQRTPDSVGFGDGRGIEPPRMVRRRGRPRKNRGDANVAPTLPLLSGSSSHGGGNATSSDPPAKRGRGGPRGSNNQQPEAIEASDGIGFIPHIFTVKPGEDIGRKLRDFSEQGPRTVCIMSGTGTVGRVTLADSSSLSGITTYEGQFPIVTLTGSFMNREVNGRMSRIGSLNVAFAGNDGRVIGGVVTGALVAAIDVQMVVGSFLEEPKKSKRSDEAEGSSGQANVNNPFVSPRSQGPSCDSTGNNEISSHPLQSPISSSNRGTSSGHSALQQHHQQLGQQQEQQWQQQQELQQRQQQQQQEEEV